MAILDDASDRPDVIAAIRGGDVTQRMASEPDPTQATLEQALFWSRIYREILAMETEVMDRIRLLMAKQTREARNEVELTNVPVVAAQAERFRRRLEFWTARLRELE